MTIRGIEVEHFERGFNAVQEFVHKTATEQGLWRDIVSIHDVVAHVHCEVSELFKAIQNGCEVSRNIPPFSHRAEEAADIVLLLMSMSKELEWDLAGAIVAKAKFNVTRER